MKMKHIILYFIIHGRLQYHIQYILTITLLHLITSLHINIYKMNIYSEVPTRCRLGIGKSSTASGSRDSEGTYMPELQLDLGASLFCANFTSFHFNTFLLVIFLCLFDFFHSCCSRAQVFGITLVHEFLFYIAILNGTYFGTYS